MERSFLNAPKHKEDPQNGAVRVCKGICHLCQAGQPGWDFEQIGTRHPTWRRSFLQQSPFSFPNPFRNIPHCPGRNQLARLFHFDFFHCWHLGMAKHYLGSALALLSQLEAGSNIDSRFEQLTDKYLQWCKDNKRPAHVQKITKEMINWVTTTSYPTGSWHKGDLSTSLMLWVESRYLNEDWHDNQMLDLAGQAAVAANTLIKLLYNSGAWLSADETLEVANYGFRFLRRYCQCALIAHQGNLRLWTIQPKAHALHHMFVGLAESAARGPSLNILCTSVQQDEDFIGRGSRLSRHAHQSHVSQRVVDRYLQAAYSKWVECGYLIRGG